MADPQGFTKPAEIAGIQEANTAVLPSGMPLNDLLLRSSQVKWAHDEAAKQREEKQMADNLAMFDFNTVGVWNKDVDAINKMKDDGIKKFGDVNFLKRYNSGDLNALSEYQQWKTGLQSSIDLSKRRMVYDSANRELMNKDKKYQNDINIQQSQKFADTPLSNNFYSMSVTPSANPYDVVAYSTKLAPDISETKEVPNGDGTFTKKTVTGVPLTGNKSLQSAADDILKDTEQLQNINQLLVDAKTTHDPNADYITYDFTKTDKYGNPIPINKKVADLDQRDIVNGLLVEERFRPQTDQTLEGSVYHGDNNGGGDGLDPNSDVRAVTDNLFNTMFNINNMTRGNDGLYTTNTQFDVTPFNKTIDGKVYSPTIAIKRGKNWSDNRIVFIYGDSDKTKVEKSFDDVAQTLLSTKGVNVRKLSDMMLDINEGKKAILDPNKYAELMGGYSQFFPPDDQPVYGKQSDKPSGTQQQGGVKPNQPTQNNTDLTKNYINVLGSQYKSMGQSQPDAYKNSWQYRPQEIDANYDKFAKGGDTREKENLLTNAGYKSIDAFENSKGTAQGASMNKGDGYSKTQEVEIKEYVKENIGMDIWNKLPPKLQTQVYSMMFNNGTKYDRDIKDNSGNIVHHKGDDNYNSLKGLAQALAPDKIKNDADRQKLTGDEAKTIIKNYFSGNSQQSNTPKTLKTKSGITFTVQ